MTKIGSRSNNMIVKTKIDCYTNSVIVYDQLPSNCHTSFRGFSLLLGHGVGRIQQLLICPYCLTLHGSLLTSFVG